ncbi:MAG TPA: hypothetical protein VME44_22920 [Streptosporangiaceae bacterium]|nr:hypothetical protein [Streptosporangiaceae bacterium]
MDPAIPGPVAINVLQFPADFQRGYEGTFDATPHLTACQVSAGYEAR